MAPGASTTSAEGPLPRAVDCVGVDGTRGRWVAVALDGNGHFLEAALVDDLASLVRERFPGARAFGVDVPIGLTDTAGRGPDMAAKKLLGKRGSTIFAVPPRAALEAETYEEARRRAVELTGKSLSAQSYALRHNILEMDRLIDELEPEVAATIHEVHPELSFRALRGETIVSNKRTWNGAFERRRVLEGAGISLPLDLGLAGDVPVDDVLDACAAAWSARRIADGRAECVPASPDVDPRGRPIAIWT